MHRPLRNLPTFDPAEFRRDTNQKWGSLGLPAGQRVIIEWLTGENTGPHVYVFPAGNRTAGITTLQRYSFGSVDERWADFLEFEYIPQVARELEAQGYRPDVICADLRPVQVQRARRRQIEAAASAKSGRPVHLQQTQEGEGAGQ
jgi:hypothetical protein